MKKIVIASALIGGLFLASCKQHGVCAAYTKAKEVKTDKAEKAS